VSVVGVSEKVVIAHVGQALLGLDFGSGRTVWRYESGDGASVLGCNRSQSVLVARREDARLALVWLDAKTGREVGRTIPDGQEERSMIIGPIVAGTDGRGWALISRDRNSTKRDFCEIVRVGDASPGLNANPESVWTRRDRQ
jgi:hypothetical protein